LELSPLNFSISSSLDLLLLFLVSEELGTPEKISVWLKEAAVVEKLLFSRLYELLLTEEDTFP